MGALIRRGTAISDLGDPVRVESTERTVSTTLKQLYNVKSPLPFTSLELTIDNALKPLSHTTYRLSVHATLLSQPDRYMYAYVRWESTLHTGRDSRATARPNHCMPSTWPLPTHTAALDSNSTLPNIIWHTQPRLST